MRIDSLPWTGHLTPPPLQFRHSIAADSENNHIFVPVTNLGVLVFDRNQENDQRTTKERTTKETPTSSRPSYRFYSESERLRFSLTFVLGEQSDS